MNIKYMLLLSLAFLTTNIFVLGSSKVTLISYLKVADNVMYGGLRLEQFQKKDIALDGITVGCTLFSSDSILSVVLV